MGRVQRNDRDRARLRLFRDAAQDPGRVVVEGFHALKHALRFGAELEVAVTTDRAAIEALARVLAPDLVTRLAALVEDGPASLLAELVRAPAGVPVAAIARRPVVDPAAVLAQRDAAPVVLLDRPTHLGNVGAVVRVAAAAGAAGVLATGPHDPWHPAALRGSAGLHFALPVARLGDLPTVARPMIAFDAEGEPLGRAPLPAGALLAFGSERRGLGPELRARADRLVAIPMRPGVSSLNLATAVAVALYAYRLVPSACS